MINRASMRTFGVIFFSVIIFRLHAMEPLAGAGAGAVARRALGSDFRNDVGVPLAVSVDSARGYLGRDVMERDRLLTGKEKGDLEGYILFFRSVLRELKVPLKRKGKNKTIFALYTQYVNGDLDRFELFGDAEDAQPDYYEERRDHCMRLLLWLQVYIMASKSGVTINEYITQKKEDGTEAEKSILTDLTVADAVADDLLLLITDIAFDSREVEDRRSAFLVHNPLPADLPRSVLFGDRLASVLSTVPPALQEQLRTYLWYRDLGTLRPVLGKILKQYLVDREATPMLTQLASEQNSVVRKMGLPCTRGLLYSVRIAPGEGLIGTLAPMYDAAWQSVCPGGTALFCVDDEIYKAAKRSLEEAIDLATEKMKWQLLALEKAREKFLLLDVLQKKHVAVMTTAFANLYSDASHTKLKRFAVRLFCQKYKIPFERRKAFLEGRISETDFASIAIECCPEFEKIHTESNRETDITAPLMRSFTINALLLAVLKKLQSFEFEGRGDLFAALAKEAGIQGVTMRIPAPPQELALVPYEGEAVAEEPAAAAIEEVLPDFYDASKKGTAEERFKNLLGRVRRRTGRYGRRDVHVATVAEGKDPEDEAAGDSD